MKVGNQKAAVAGPDCSGEAKGVPVPSRMIFISAKAEDDMKIAAIILTIAFIYPPVEITSMLSV